ncbi:MAG: hypothetical protein KC481_06205 [Acidimicrobiaceae bacterium]|jgi:Arc/MetJ-type ribon-helix-helix transcriptional regulator|uniref:CopG family transcriptional regulator n=1 Tax=Ilumatobacter sp. TaxID=1967498 RepID=UPI00237495C8|nr:hypothetical protein [Acidimicrobiaceae bacterium]MCO4833233.1 hypothetical protein [Acidimicrobiaceae bacterium]MDB4206088.1 hypothetical protein [bacterium]MDG1089000.1 hypothetical protein [Acidimicrobiales bacterium]
MATRKITITVEENDLARIREMVQAGTVKSVSGFVQRAVTRSLDADRLLDEYLAAVVAEGGPLTESETAWLDELFPIPQ